MSAFARDLIRWQRVHGRHGLPWQGGRDPYRIWLAEIMLQQTQVETVIPYYGRFLARFPTLAGLAAAPLEQVMPLWSGLGYYARARNLHRAARQVMETHGGHFPRSADEIARLPGIGRSTAAAIAAFAYDERGAILDGNVRRVLCRVFGIEGFPGVKAVENRLWELAESLLPESAEGVESDIAVYTQAQMDLGATVCTRSRPACGQCPLAADCIARCDGRTSELPAARPRKAAPRRQTWVAVIVRDGAVLLERRPPAGLWGGLLALPEIPASAGGEAAAGKIAGLAAWSRETLGLLTSGASALAPLNHAFTHFTLEIRPLRLEARPDGGRVMEMAAYAWQPLSTIANAALPAPVRRILEALAEAAEKTRG